MDKVLILGARQWTITEEGRESFSGVTVEFVESYPETNDRHHGISVQKVTAPSEMFDQFAKSPMIAEVEFGRKPGKNGKSETCLKSVKFVKAFDPVALAV